MKLFRLHAKENQEPPDDWSRVLIPFAGTGLRLLEEYTKDCIIEAGPLLIKDIMRHLGEYIELFDYDPSLERDFLARKSKREEQEDLW